MRVLDKIRRMALPALAAVLVLGASAGNSSSYFTTYVTAQGSETVRLRDVRVEVNDTVEVNTKNIAVHNTGEAPCYVRAKAIQAGTVQVPITYAGDGWTTAPDSSGYYYYMSILEPGALAPTLYATINLPTSGTEKPIPEGTEFNVQVVTECTKVLHDEAGTPLPNGPDYAGWTLREG